MPSWAWNAAAGRYRDVATGRFITNAQAQVMIEESIAASGAAVDTMASLAAEGAMSSRGWLTAMREEIKREYIRQYTAGIGGVDRMTQRDWGSVGGMIRDQYRYLDGFAEQLGQLSEAQIRARAQMYINSAREAYERAHGRVASKSGFASLVSWVVNPAAENCPDCLEYQAMGPQEAPTGGGFPVGDSVTWPGSGSTQCLTNCKCELTYTNEQGEEFWQE